MSWKYAVHTISWGNKPLNTIAREVAESGYAGAELFQHPGRIGGVKAVIEEFDKHNVHLVGVAFGAFLERCDFVREMAKIRKVSVNHQSLPYVYCDEWREDVSHFKAAALDGLKIALHPHMYKPVQNVDEAQRILDANPSVLALPDTAHLKVAGNDPVEAIKTFYDRLAGIHLKSWREEVGRSFHFYARGFCELGEGDVDIEAVLLVLQERQFSGWLIVELDSTATPLESATQSRKWLENAKSKITSA